MRGNKKRQNRNVRKSWSLIFSIMSLKTAVIVFFSQIVIGMVGFMVVEHFSLREALYMSVITISTVGFSEVKPLSPNGQLFTSILIIFNIAVFTYLATVASYFVVQGKIFKKLQQYFMDRQISKLENHVILCGFGKYGKEVAEHFHDHSIPFVVIDLKEQKNEQLADANTLFICDDATHDEALQRAGITHAKAIICALPDDTDNVFIVISAKNLNPGINVISRAKEYKTQKKLQMVGADHVIMPEQIGGFYMATLVSKPGAVEFFSFIARDYDSDIEFEEVSYEDLPSDCKGKSVVEMGLRASTGTNIIGFMDENGKYQVNPSPETRLRPHTKFILLGSRKQMAALRDFLKTKKRSFGS